jgi:hypothetical protein
MGKVRGDLLLPIRTVEEVRNVRCAAFQRPPGVYSRVNCSVFILGVEVAMEMPKRNSGA